MKSFKYKHVIAAEYGLSPKTLQRKLVALGLSLPRGYLSPLQQKEIYEVLGYPPGVDKQPALERNVKKDEGETNAKVED